MTARPNLPTEVTLDMIPWPHKEARRLELATRILVARGWCRGQLEDRRGHVCALRAYQLADRTDPHGGYGLLAVSIVLSTNLTVAQWNDTNGRRRSDVVHAFQTAARELMNVAYGNG